MNVKLLKAIVVFLGVLIVFGVVGLFVGLIYKIDADKGFQAATKTFFSAPEKTFGPF